MIARVTRMTVETRVIGTKNLKIYKMHLPASCFFNKSEDCGSDINYNCEIYPDDTKQMIFPQKMAG